MPQVSVVMPVYNGERFLGEAIESVLAQTFGDFELIVVDDGSSDGSVRVIRQFGQRDARVRLIQLARNMGKADARNGGIAAARGEFLTMMDCDDVSLPRRLEKQVAFLQANPDIGAVGTRGRTVNRDLTPGRKHYAVPLRHALIVWELFFGEAVLGATVMYRRQLLVAAGGYEPGRRYVEDLELAGRLALERKVAFANLPEDLFLYRIHDQPKFSRGPAREQREAAIHDLRRRNLERVLGRAPTATLERFWRVRIRADMDWRERRAAKRDMRDLIDALIAQGCIAGRDRPLLAAETRRLLAWKPPRLWQMFLHWWRYRVLRRR